MSLLGSEEPKESPINYLERPEFLGDAVLGFICSISLFYLFPDLGEGSLSMLRCALGMGFWPKVETWSVGSKYPKKFQTLTCPY